MDCSKITKGFVAGQCGAIPTGGTGTLVWLFNYSDIDRENSEVTDTELTELVLKTSAKGYIYQSLDNSTTGEATLNVGTFVRTYDHRVTLRIFDDESTAKEFLAEMKEARVIAIVQRKTTGDNALEVYGWQSGLKLTENSYSTTFTDNVAYPPVLASDNDSKESQLPLTCAMTEAELNALCQTT